MRLDVMAAAARYGCSDAALRRLFKHGGIDGRYEEVVGESGKARRRLTFDEADLAAAFAGPLAHLARRGLDSPHLEALLAGMTQEEREQLGSRLDAVQAAEAYGCSESRIRQSHRRGLLKGVQTPFRDQDGRMSMKLTFSKAELQACYAKDATAQEKRAAHVASIRAAATPFSDEQKRAIAGAFLDHLRERQGEAESDPIDDDEGALVEPRDLVGVG